nr:ATP-binding cassette domain-containing protein [Alteribacter natronophilus]
MSSLYAVELSDVLKRFACEGGLKTVFTQADLKVREGEFIAVRGSSGSGKTTLLNMIAAMTPPNKGTVSVFGENLLKIPDRPEWRLKTIGFISREAILAPYLSPRQHLLQGIPAGSTSYRNASAKADGILGDLGLGAVSDESLEGLNERDRVLTTIALVLMNTPRLILADDPARTLTGSQGTDVLCRLITFARRNRITVIIAGNDRILHEEADRIFTLKQGRVVPYPEETPLKQAE